MDTLGYNNIQGVRRPRLADPIPFQSLTMNINVNTFTGTFCEIRLQLYEGQKVLKTGTASNSTKPAKMWQRFHQVLSFMITVFFPSSNVVRLKHKNL